ncbi:hypothetical protein [Shimia abyssi]|uniref:Uncharacterized protein n=1 Tax=Shimia abyssi TaxID=1662395 RepID=A0A2P8FIQ1_9RHOB|nr:hypothetical protein [Shimia abyssi]PSL21592.1 hypothetical protein CLV88_10114 [Shimia abyssi]
MRGKGCQVARSGFVELVSNPASFEALLLSMSILSKLPQLAVSQPRPEKNTSATRWSIDGFEDPFDHGVLRRHPDFATRAVLDFSFTHPAREARSWFGGQPVMLRDVDWPRIEGRRAVFCRRLPVPICAH